MSKPKKKILLVNRAFQLRYMAAAFGIGIMTTCLTGIVILYPLFVFGILRIPNFLPLPIFIGMFLAFFINITIIMVFSLVITHRVAGPMYSLAKHLRWVGFGKFSEQMRFRDQDEFKFLARNFNEMVVNLNLMVLKDLEVLPVLKEAIEPPSSEEARQLAMEACKQLEKRWLERVKKVNPNEV